MQDLTQTPTYVVKNYDIETGEFDVYYNDGSLNNSEWYGPIHMDLDSMLPEIDEPLQFQIATRVHSHVVGQQIKECNMDASKQVLAQMIGVEQKISMADLMEHQAQMRKKETVNTDPICQSTQIMNIYSADDFDEQFEALSAELAAED